MSQQVFRRLLVSDQQVAKEAKPRILAEPEQVFRRLLVSKPKPVEKPRMPQLSQQVFRRRLLVVEAKETKPRMKMRQQVFWRLLVLKPHREGSEESNVLLDMPLPQSSEPISVREQSNEFIELREYVKRQAYGSYSRSMQDLTERDTDESGDSL